jgi:4-hydroxythreonine-4-phosphate dehydrogenase
MLKAGQLDGVVSLYHDQGHPVMKTLAFDFRKGRVRGVNVTLGLPIVRTSPDHGTGFDIAWRGHADDGSMVDAIRLAHRMSAHRRKS